VAIADGLALDPHGREIVYPGGEFDVPAQPPTTNLAGYFLVISYSERRIPADEDPCLEPGVATTARVREIPELAWTEHYPNHDSCRQGTGTAIDCGIVLAFVPISKACEIEGIELGVREYSHPTHTSQVSAIALEGEKDIDKDNPKELRFVVPGGAPDSITLYLWGGKFSSLYYTEMGQHAHVLSNIQVGSVTTSLPPHTHSLSDHTHSLPQVDGTTGTLDPLGTRHLDGDHRHHLKVVRAVQAVGGWSDVMVRGRGVDEDSTIEYQVQPPGPPFETDWIPADGSAVHSHRVSIGLGSSRGPSVPQTGAAENVQSINSPPPTFSAKIDPAGSPTYNVRGGAAYEWPTDMQVALDGTDVTKSILDLLKDRVGWGSPPQLGNGTGSHPFVTEGTGEINLLRIAKSQNIDMSRDQHILTFSVNGGGGKVIYNLYIE
jgi:hypothetical protein